MFSKNNKQKTKRSKNEITLKGHKMFSKHFNLTDNKLLFISKNMARTHTYLSVFSRNNLSECLAQRTMEGLFYLECIFPDGSFIIKKSSNHSILKICPETLVTISEQTLIFDSLCALNNDSFFALIDLHKLSKKQQGYSLITYQWNENSWENTSQTPIFINASIDNIQKISQNRYCCTLYLNSELQILILEHTDSGQFVEKGIIKPPIQFYHDSSDPACKVVLFKNGHILTYHDCYDGIQIWNSETGACVKKWNWSEIRVPKKFLIWNITILPFSDSVHVLVLQNNNLYLFNTHSLIMHPLEVNFKVACYPPHILANDKIIAFTSSLIPDHCSMVPFEIPKLLDNKKIQRESQLLVKLFFNRNKIPPEISRQICGYAFGLEGKELFARKINDNEDTNQEKCLVM